MLLASATLAGQDRVECCATLISFSSMTVEPEYDSVGKPIRQAELMKRAASQQLGPDGAGYSVLTCRKMFDKAESVYHCTLRSRHSALRMCCSLIRKVLKLGPDAVSWR